MNKVLIVNILSACILLSGMATEVTFNRTQCLSWSATYNLAERRALNEDLNIIFDVSSAKIGSFIDGRKLDNVPLDSLFSVNHASFFQGFNETVANGSRCRVIVIDKIEGAFEEMSEFEQRTPAFRIVLTFRPSANATPRQIESFAFGPRYNNLKGSVEERSEKQIESATSAYFAAIVKAAIALSQDEYYLPANPVAPAAESR